MKLPIYQLDVFTNNIFEGNPASVVVMDECIDQQLMQQIAMENNQSETAFIKKEEDYYKIRWFTPTVEVDLCGHATLASAHVVLYNLEPRLQEVTFHSTHYQLTIRKEEDNLAMTLPTASYQKVEAPGKLIKGLGKTPQEVYLADDYMAVFEETKDIMEMEPDFTQLRQLDCRGIIVTAPGHNSDFVSRFFAPSIGVNEDPVTGSAHTKLTPYWARRLNKSELTAEQLSQRGGRMICRQKGKDTELLGHGRVYMQGHIQTK